MLHLSCNPACSWVSVAIFRPRPPYTACHLIQRLIPLSLAFHATGFVRTAILRSLDQRHTDTHEHSADNTVAVFSIWEKGWLASDLDDGQGTPYRHKRIPKAHCYEKAIPPCMAETVDAGWYEASCSYCVADACVTVGDVVHVGFVSRVEEYAADDEGEESMLAYSCLATLKSYVKDVAGLHSYSFYSCLHRAPADDDGISGAAEKNSLTTTKMCSKAAPAEERRRRKRRRSRTEVMAGLGVWRDVESALAFLSRPGGNPAERFWQSLGARSSFNIYQVVHAASD